MPIAQVKKLAELQQKHKKHQMSLFDVERKKSEKERMLEKVFNDFDDFESWVAKTLEIVNNPYIRVIAAITGVNR
jgi:hypothetical protein